MTSKHNSSKKIISPFKKKIIKFFKISKLIFIFFISYFIYYIFFIYQYFYHSNQLILETNIGTNQGYHPKVVCFNELWNGFKYWMAYTPYPYKNNRKENPTINASNNLINWYTPKGLKNPLDIPRNTKYSNNYNSDTHILYNIDTKRLELFWRYCFKEKKIHKIIIYKMTSENGVLWSKKNIFLKSEDRLKHDYISPTIIYENGTYKIWYVFNRKINYLEKVGKIIKNHRILNITFENNYYPWHIDIIYNKKMNIYEMVVCAYMNNYRSHMPLFYSSSKNNLIWNKPFVIMRPSKNNLKWDSKGLYRSCLLYENGYYYLFYSGHNYNRRTGIGLMYGKIIYHLKPYIMRNLIFKKNI